MCQPIIATRRIKTGRLGEFSQKQLAWGFFSQKKLMISRESLEQVTRDKNPKRPAKTYEENETRRKSRVCIKKTPIVRRNARLNKDFWSRRVWERRLPKFTSVLGATGNPKANPTGGGRAGRGGGIKEKLKPSGKAFFQ